MNISGTEIALVFGGQIVAKHPRFTWELEGSNLRDLLERIVREDVNWITRRRRR